MLQISAWSHPAVGGEAPELASEGVKASAKRIVRWRVGDVPDGQTERGIPKSAPPQMSARLVIPMW